MFSGDNRDTQVFVFGLFVMICLAHILLAVALTKYTQFEADIVLFDNLFKMVELFSYYFDPLISFARLDFLVVSFCVYSF